jgi:fumarylacetoacetase
VKSWLRSANDPGTDFPLENLPYGMCDDGIVVAIGDYAFHVSEAARRGELEAPASLNELLTWPAESRAALRRALQALLRQDAKTLTAYLSPLAGIVLRRPVDVGDYTDFYASIYHATNVGRLFRPDNPLLPNYKYVPIGYHGRASSIVVSGATIPRPSGQTMPANAVEPVFGPTRSLDYELEAGFYVAEGLVRARHSGLGIPAAWPVPFEELRHLGIALDRGHRSSRTFPCSGFSTARGRSRTAALSRFAA